MVSLANVMETGVPLNDYPDGSYDWHIDAEDAVRNSSGHYEDQIVKLKTGYSATIQKSVNVGSLNLYQKNHLEWEQYLANLDPSVTAVDVDVRTYHVGQINFTTDRSPILSGGSARTGNGIASSDQTSNLQTLTFTVEDFIKEINNRDSSLHLAVDVAGNDFVNGRLQVAYATTVTVRVGSASIPLTNDDVHWIVYTSGDNTTYVFQQIADPAYAQIKQGGLDNEKYEAMAGTPTTEDLFVSMGGDQYIVQMQYAYCEDDYTRTYQMSSNPVANFDYYSVETPGSVSKGVSYSKSVDSHGDYRSDVNNWISTATGYWNDRDSYAASARAEAHSKLNSMVKGTNKATYGSMYEVCETGETADMKSFIDSTCVTGGSGGSQTFTLFKGTDPETGEPFAVDITVTIGISENAPNTSGPNYDGHHGPHYQHDNDGTNPAVPPVTDPNTGAVITPGTPATTIPCSHVYYDEYTSGSASVSFSYNVSFAITTTGIGNSCLGAPATISETQTVKQTFKNVKYTKCLNSLLWRKESMDVIINLLSKKRIFQSWDLCLCALDTNLLGEKNVRGMEIKMRALFIGGTGTISTAITNRLTAEENWELYLINRGLHEVEVPENVKVITADINKEEEVAEKIKDLTFDTVCDFIGFVPEQLERDYRLFKGKTKQFMYISSASAYHKPVTEYRITEGTALANPYWEYSRNKIACEDYLMKLYREEGFPVTIVRPSHTYSERAVPVGVHGDNGSFQVLKRMMEGKPVLVHGDGNSLWTITFNTDFAKGFVGLMANPHAIGEAFQITSDESLTWNQIHQIAADKLGVEYKPYYVSSEYLDAVSSYDFRGGLLGDKACTVVFDNTKIKRIVPDFVCTVSARKGIGKAIDYILSHPECQKEDAVFDAWCDKVIAGLEEAKKKILTEENPYANKN